MPMSIQASSKALVLARATLSQRSIPQAYRAYASQSNLNSDKEHVNTIPEHLLHQAVKGPINVAIIGGGITGLAAAHRLMTTIGRTLTVKITVFDEKPTLGGWLKSDFVEVPGGKVLLESGPRTLRPAGFSGLVTLSLIHELKLEEELLTCSKHSVAAKNRYVYYPDHLVRMPSSLSDIPGFLREPLAEGLLSGVLKELIVPVDVAAYNALKLERGPTVDEIISKRMNPRVTNLLSAVLHGIYAGDVEQLGFGALFPQGQYNLRRWKGLIRGMLADAVDATLHERCVMHKADAQELGRIRRQWEDRQDIRLHQRRIGPRTEALKKANSSSVYSFKKGLQQLSDTLVEELRQSPDVSLRPNCPIHSIAVYPGKQLPAIVRTTKATHDFSYIISTIPMASTTKLWRKGLELSQRDKDRNAAKHISTPNGSVTVMVVNLWYSQPDLLPVQGFGYLIPKDIPASQNPELGLGVVFDSDAIQGQDTVPGTKLTVMMGGHYWNTFSKKQLPSESEGIANARSLVARHLGITQEPAIARSSLQYNCIPQYGPTHNAFMSRFQQDLKSGPTQGRLIVAGASYDGVGVNDCVKSGRWAADSISMGEVGLRRSGRETPDQYIHVPLDQANWKFS